MPTMQPYELQAWLGPAADDLTPEQTTDLLAQHNRWLLAHPEDAHSDRGTAMLTARVQVLLGELDLRALSAQHLLAATTEAAARRELYAGIIAATDAGLSEVDAARLSGISRNTVRKITGK